jgi:hypothetical protein
MPGKGRSDMTIRTTIKDADSGNTVDMDLESDNTVEEIIESAASFWSKDAGAYVLKWGRKLLRGGIQVSEAGVRDGDTLELIPDPEGGA